MNFTLFITVLLTAVTLVVAAYVIAKLIGPRSYNPVKGEPFECGIPTRGSSWLPSTRRFSPWHAPDQVGKTSLDRKSVV